MDAQHLTRRTNEFTNPPSYTFASHRLRKTLRDSSKEPIVLVACGSFSPVTYLHLRMFEMAKDYVRQSTNFEIVGGYLSPVSDQYNKPGLLSAHHRPRTLDDLMIITRDEAPGPSWLCRCINELDRHPGLLIVVRRVADYSDDLSASYFVLCLTPRKDTDSHSWFLDYRANMCTLAAEETSSWLMIDSWEAFQNYQRTAVVLDHFDYEINTILGGVHTQDGEHRDVRVMLLAGSDLITTMSEPGVWAVEDLDHILGRYGTFIIERAGSSMDQATDNLARWRSNIHLVPQLIQNDVSSTKVRLFLRRGLSVRYLLPAAVVDYIEEHNLYLDEGSVPEKEKGKDKDSGLGKQESDVGYSAKALS